MNAFKLTSHCFLALAVASLAGACAADADPCEAARDHVETCAGPDEAADFAETCNDELASEALATDCDSLPDPGDKADGGGHLVDTVVDATTVLDSPAAAVWARVSDHASTHSWILDASVELVTPSPAGARGGNPNGVGAVREVTFPNSAHLLWRFATLEEQIMTFDEPRTFSYKIIAGLPGLHAHLGTLTVDPVDSGHSRLTWHVDFQFQNWPKWLAARFTAQFQDVVQRGLDELRAQEAAE